MLRTGIAPNLSGWSQILTTGKSDGQIELNSFQRFFFSYGDFANAGIDL